MNRKSTWRGRPLDWTDTTPWYGLPGVGEATMPIGERIAAGVIKIIVFLSVILTVILRVWIVMKLWNWYVTPALELPPLRFIYAFGIELLVFHIVQPRPKNGDSIWYVWFGLAITILMGWLGTFFI